LPHRRQSGGRHRPCSTGHRRAGMHLPLDGDLVARPRPHGQPDVPRPGFARRMIRRTGLFLAPSMPVSSSARPGCPQRSQVMRRNHDGKARNGSSP
jgi:hypothetical protein